MSSVHRTFIDLALNGEVIADEIDDFVAAWHDGDFDAELHDYLGMSWDEYRLWASDSAYLTLILSARHNRRPLRQLVNENYLSSQSATSSRRSARRMQLDEWLKHAA